MPAAERGLADRAAFVEGPAADHTEPADLVLSHRCVSGVRLDPRGSGGPARPRAAAELRAKLDEHLSIWLRGTHGVFGFAYLILGVSA
ncbi:hypothetical protein ABH920_005840 [Catenulispora sp. EB89]|uniref:hypothetical protein n=1 Tax=Catenulispora sp. EB89 TaxID=3156257 RepID=UPI00351602FA